MPKILGALGLLLAASAASQAQTLEGIEILATRLPAAAPEARSASSTIAGEDLERRQIVFVSDALSTLPGLSIAQNGAFGGVSSLRMRGASSEQTLVLIDSVAVNDPSAPGGGYNFGMLDAFDIARIDVLRGPHSTLWGSDAIGGVIAITTRRPGPGISGGAFAEAGSYGALRFGADAAFANQRFDLRLSALRSAADGISAADEDDGNTERDDFLSSAWGLRAGWDATESLRIEAHARLTETEADFDSYGFNTGVADGDETAFSEERTGAVLIRHTGFSGRLESTLQASRADFDRVYAGPFPFETGGAREALRYQGVLRATDALNLAFGAEREENRIDGGGATTLNGAFLLAEATPIETLTFSAGLRRDDHSDFGDVTTARLGARWRPAQNVTLHASWGEGFKAPTIFQLTSFFFPASAPNAALRPETSQGWDIGLETRHFSDRLTLSLIYFDLETTNLIDYVNGRYENIAQAESHGWEAEARWSLTPQLDLSMNFTRTEAHNIATGAPLLRVPENAANLSLDWRATPSLALGLDARFNGEEWDVPRPANPSGRIPSWTRLNLRAAYALSDEAELYARIENLTDENYQDTYGYGAPGRSAYAGVRMRFE